MTSSDTTTRVVDADHPWLGLSPFTEATQGFFFGRDDEIRDLFLRVREQPLTVLYGQSGLGKTSLLGAGLVPKLKVEGFRPALVRLGYDDREPPLVQQALSPLWDGLPRPSIVRDEADAVGTPRDEEDGLGRPSHAETPSYVHQTLWEFYHHIPSRPAELIECPPVLIFDQFEEIFTLAHSAERQAEARELFAQLADLVENRPPAAVQEKWRADRKLAREYDLTVSPVRVVLTLREDYLSQLEVWKKLMPSIMRNRMGIELLNGSQALEAVVRPGRMAGRRLVSDEVGAQIVRFVARRPTETPLSEIGAVPPLLSLICDELNDARLAAGASAITAGQVAEQSADILQNFYTRSFDGLPADARRFVERRMVTVGGHRNAVAREDAIEEFARGGVGDPAAAIDQLIQRRLLSAEERGGVRRLEITHDVLAPLVVRSRDERRAREAKEAAEQQAREAQAAAQRHARELRTARVWDADSGKPIGEPLPHDKDVLRARFSPDGNRVVSASYDHTARIWDANTGRAVSEPLRHLDVVTDASFSLDGGRIVTASNDHTARVWDAATGRPIGGSLRHDHVVFSASFNMDGTRIVTASADHTARIWDATTGEPIGEPLTHGDSVDRAWFSPDGKLVLGVEQLNDPLDTDECWFSPGGTKIGGHTMRCWDRATGKEIGELSRRNNAVNRAWYSPDGKRVITTSADTTARVWDAATGNPIGEPLRNENKIHGAAFNPDGTRIITVTVIHTATRDVESIARIWDPTTGEPMGEPLRHRGWVSHLSFSQDGTRILTTNSYHTAQLWDPNTGQPFGQSLGRDGDVSAASFSPDGTRIVTSCFDKTARVWDAATGQPIGEPLRHEAFVRASSFNHDGTRIVTAGADDTARVWDATTGHPIGGPLRHERVLKNASLSPDGKRVLTVTGNLSSASRIWDAVTGQPIGEPLRHNGTVEHASFSPDGTRIVTASWDQTAQIWDATTGKPLGEPLQHQSSVFHASFSADGMSIVTASADHTARVWDWKPTRDLDASLLPRFVPFLSGAVLDPELGTLKPLSYQERLELWKELEPAIADNPEWLFLARTAFPRSPDSPISPRSTMTLREAASRLIRTGVPGCLREARSMDPGHPLIQIALAKLEDNPTRAGFLREYGTTRLPDDAAVCREAAEMLLEQKDKPHAARALEKAAKLDPQHRDLIRLREALEAAE